MSTMNADTSLTTTRRLGTDPRPSSGPTGLLTRAVVAVAALIAGADR